MAGAALTPTDGANSFAAWLPIMIIFIGTPIFMAFGGMDRGIVIAIGGMFGAFGAMLLPMALSERLRLRHLSRLYRAGIREAAVKPNGLTVDRHFLLLSESGLVLREVALQPGTPAVLTFTSAFYRLSMGQRVLTGAERVYRLPVPRGCEEEASALVARFREEFGSS
jgi:hypothetical protein